MKKNCHIFENCGKQLNIPNIDNQQSFKFPIDDDFDKWCDDYSQMFWLPRVCHVFTPYTLGSLREHYAALKLAFEVIG